MLKAVRDIFHMTGVFGACVCVSFLFSFAHWPAGRYGHIEVRRSSGTVLV